MEYVIERDTSSHPFHRHWQFCVGSGHAPLTLRADYQQQLRYIHDQLGIRYVRFHGVLSDDMEVMNSFADIFPLNGAERFTEYNFRHVAAAYDGVLDAGMKPFVELSFMPRELASRDDHCFFYYKDKNVIAPPKDYDKWEELVRKFVEFVIARYGKDEVETWYFEVWNEPDLAGFFTGKKEEYFYLYEVTARAIKEVDENLRVGGPATSASKWVHGFLEYCAQHRVPVDFVSTHQYAGDPVGMIDVDGIKEKEEKPQDFGDMSMLDIFAGLKEGNVLDALRYMMPDKSETEDIPDDVFRTNAGIVRKQIDGSSVKTKDGKNLPLIYTEWSENSIFSAFTNDTRKEAAYDVRAALDTERVIDASSVWCFSDIFEEFHIFPQEFHGGFGLLTQSGIEKPAFWGLKFLSDITGERLDLPSDAMRGEISIAAFRDSDRALTQVLLVRQKMKNLDLPKEHLDLLVELPDVPADVTVKKIDEDHGNPLKIWKELGSPDIPTREQVRQIRGSSAVEEESIPATYENGKVKISADLGVNDVWLITIREK